MSHETASWGIVKLTWPAVWGLHHPVFTDQCYPSNDQSERRTRNSYALSAPTLYIKEAKVYTPPHSIEKIYYRVDKKITS